MKVGNGAIGDLYILVGTG